MFNQTTFQTSYSEPSAAGQLQAHHLFDRALMAGRINKLSGAITHRSRQLKSMAGVQSRIASRHYQGVQTVEISHIQGSVDRADSFDIDFNPIQEHTKFRWVSIVMAMQEGRALPPVELVQVGDVYYVVDGHHRISAARALGQTHIDAIVTVAELSAA